MSKRAPYTITEDPKAKRIWRSLEEKANPAAFKKDAQTEFKDPPQQITGSLSRRGFLGAGAASAALLSEACIRRPVEKILPYTKAPEYIVPGIASHYASILEVRGEPFAVLVECHEGRPTKIEGNPDHPTSMGGTSLSAQALTMDLYDADRSAGPLKGGVKCEMEELEEAWVAAVRAAKKDQGGKLAVLMPPTASPTVLRLLKKIREDLPHTTIARWAPVAESNARAGTKLAFGNALRALPDYAAARVIVSIDCDFLQLEHGNVRAAKLFAKGRRISAPEDAKTMSRLFAADSWFSLTGANADHRLRLPAGGMDGLLRALAGELSAAGVDVGDVKSSVAGAKADGGADTWVKAAAKELAANKGKSVIVVGRNQPAHVHALAAVLNDALGALGKTLAYVPFADALEPDDLGADLAALVKGMSEGKVETLVILGCNPVYDGPGDLDFAGALAKVKDSFHFGTHRDETSEKCAWHMPLAHELESWGDARAIDGSYSIRQPMIAPLYKGKTAIEALAVLAGEPAKAHDVVQRTFQENAAMPAAWSTAWAKALQLGVIRQSATAITSGRPNVAAVASELGKQKAPAAPSAQDLEVVFVPCPKMWDGRHANNPWMQEVPDPMTKIVWDNAALVSVETAKALGISSGDVITLSSEGGKSVDVAAWVMPGQPDHTIALSLGWGRAASGRHANGRGFNVSPLRTSKALGFARAKVQKKGERHDLVQTQDHASMEARPIAIDATVKEYLENPEFTKFRSVSPRTLPLWQPVEYKGHKWGMTIDLNACTGCNACAVACIAENNIAVVGKDQVYRGREMHWIRVDRYFVGDEENEPEVAFQPVACVQCEDAPCENVCPVNATAHSDEGLNDMAYNRCIGTRYCANNCPYKVRRFNYLNWWGRAPYDPISMYGDIPETTKMVFNPNVTVRMRGVMEKCTYCVQRIEEAKIGARRTGQPITDGSLQSACQQACPSEAIHFGDLNDKASKVAALQKTDRAYALLGVIGTHPRTMHLGKIRNPSPEMPAPAPKKEG